ncbi:hypothetical protein JCM31826_01760 [Thermaurantimonas aggregans]|uniref:Lipocalin-like domain-containing protein n=1 Tax=Thermaurantimonas aggregans TaxID=2173829 RepID=A0A401XI94_9FLAO|nr:DUF5004 domain-containing protein [Thermaurantimonas aggregans]MCX8149297.1 DUF5004 domain-containing protein [Thermaurantimonas aggregans]GCD76694.1 hypothetical protein JCM31826_01760 [Thermaurantimonas aggregans]
MKKILISLTILGAAIACRPERKGELGPDPNLAYGIVGRWRAAELSITDFKSPLGDELNVSEDFATLGDPLEITFNPDNTYQVNNPGNIPTKFGTSGTWAFNNPEFPSTMGILNNNGETDTIHLRSMARDYDPVWKIQIRRENCENDLYVGYNLTLIRQ